MSRVLLVNSSLALGGLERQLILLAESLPADWKRLVWTIDGGPYERLCNEHSVPLVIAGRRSRYDPSPAFDLWRLVHRWRPDVVHSWHWMSTAASVPVCRALSIPLVDGSIRRGDRPKGRLRPHRALLRLASVVVANSRAGLHAYGLDESRAQVVYNGFDSGRLDLCERRSEDGRLTVVMCARMDGHKDYRTLLAAAQRLTEQEPRGARSWRFVLVGDGPDRARLVAEASKLIAEGVVEILDGGLEVMKIVSRAHVGVLMTNPDELAEGCSNALLEYMACGLPVVCSDSGGNQEVVEDGVTGHIIPPRDVAALADALRRLRDREDERQGMGEAGRRRLLREFSLERMVRRYTLIYDQAIARRGL